MEAARGQMQRVRGLFEQLEARLVRFGDLIEQSAAGIRVGPHRLDTQRAETLELPPARRDDPSSYVGAALPRCGQRKIGSGHRRHLDLYVDAVEQRARNPRLVLRRTAWSAPTGLARTTA